MRYSCQVALPAFGEAAQQQLQNAKVLIVGAGGLGCPASQYLTSSGIGELGIADFDTVSLSNLHRQILYTPDDIGMKKAAVACYKLSRQNPLIKLVPYDIMVTSGNVLELVSCYDIVVDGTDNFETRYLLNDACVLAGKPLIYGAVYQFEGQVAACNILNEDGTRSPNYRDIFPAASATRIPNCAEGGVLPTVAGIIGCMQANEVIKYITKTGELLAGKLLILDALSLRSRVINTGVASKIKITSIRDTIALPTISASELQKAINQNLYQLIDVRNSEERVDFNIGGRHIPLNELENDLSYFDTIQPIVFYCASGRRSAQAVSLVKEKFPLGKIFSLEGGLKAWKEHCS